MHGVSAFVRFWLWEVGFWGRFGWSIEGWWGKNKGVKRRLHSIGAWSFYSFSVFNLLIVFSQLFIFFRVSILHSSFFILHSSLFTLHSSFFTLHSLMCFQPVLSPSAFGEERDREVNSIFHLFLDDPFERVLFVRIDREVEFVVYLKNHL